ncbi:MAG: FliA/WhiG family RNA polymerase sigma factor [Nannocystaceae bacterium]|nr:FliA/WhiG family RNA polymerase sigma factor [Nannocystaceae bacterium]
MEHAPIARRIALRMARRLPDPVLVDDVVAAAYLGLTQAAERYDAKRGEPFLGFAEQRIRGAVYDELRRADILPRRQRQKAKRVQDTMRRLEQKLGRAADDQEVATDLGVSVSEYRKDLEQLTHVAVVEFQEYPAAAADSPVALTERRDLLAKVMKALHLLPTRDAQLLSLYYIEELTYAELGEIFSISVGRVSQLHARAITRLRTKLEEPPALTEQVA